MLTDLFIIASFVCVLCIFGWVSSVIANPEERRNIGVRLPEDE
jgi:hypothetical protein